LYFVEIESRRVEELESAEGVEGVKERENMHSNTGKYAVIKSSKI
jgi:hypothetical protein